MAFTGPIIVPVADIRQVVCASNVTVNICSVRAIRDTAGHDPTNDVLINVIDCRAFSGNKVLFVQNTTDQTVTFSIAASFDGVTNTVYALGTSKTVTANFAGWFDPNTATPLGYNYPYLSLLLSFTVAPTVGGVTANLIMRTI